VLQWSRNLLDDRNVWHRLTLFRIPLLVVALFVVGLGYSTLPAAAKLLCTAPDALEQFRQPMPSFKAAIDAGGPIRIVALGSSSTSGAGATRRDRTYPARLSRRLGMRFPTHHVRVFNRGKGGELARHMLARLSRDVLALKPHVVLWQTGVNDAIRHVDMDEFRATLDQGLRLMREAGIDVVLMDQQYYPRSVNVRGYGAYLDLLRRIGRDHGVPVFRRYELMTHLVESAQYKVEDLLAADRFHLNDRSYACVGRVLADALAASVEN
ncbi:MAG: SGNH/GDSL hydrolase family protein, partial [Pseudomonadota bacterium]